MSTYTEQSPVTVEQLKLFLKIDDYGSPQSVEDDLLEMLLVSATSFVQRYIGYSFECFTAGSPPMDVPVQIQHGVLAVAAHYYEHRETNQPLPQSILDSLYQWKVLTI